VIEGIGAVIRVKIAQDVADHLTRADTFAFGAGKVEHANQALDESGLRVDVRLRHGRGAGLNPKGRFEEKFTTAFDDGWVQEEPPAAFKTTVVLEKPRRIITSNQSPDLPFDRSINPYRGCEHGCIYCYARPSHSYMGLSAGLDFETQIFAKPEAAKLLEQEFSHPKYKPKFIAIGTNTDPYQPVEKKYALMREILTVFLHARHPLIITTKSALILRDLDLLSQMAEKNLIEVGISITTLDRKMARAMEPRAATPSRRLETIAALARAHVPVRVMVAPLIPGLNDHEMEAIAEAASQAGAHDGDYILLRLPFEVAPLFKDWLLREYPDRYRRVMGLLRSMRGEKDYDANWQNRMCGSGPFADVMARRFQLVKKRFFLGKMHPRLSFSAFTPPREKTAQLSLF